MITLTTERIVRIEQKILETPNLQKNLGQGHVLAEIEKIVIEEPTAVIVIVIVIEKDQDHDLVIVASYPDAVVQENIAAEILVRGDLTHVTATETEKIAIEEIVDLVVMTMEDQREQRIQKARHQEG